MWLNVSVATLNATLQLLVLYRLDVNFKNITIYILYVLNTHIHVDSENQLILKMPKLTHISVDQHVDKIFL